MHRVAQLLSIVAGEKFGQIFITDCNKVRLQSPLDRAAAAYRLYNVGNGEIRQ